MSMKIGNILETSKVLILRDICETDMWLDPCHERAVHIDYNNLEKVINNRLTEALKDIEMLRSTEIKLIAELEKIRNSNK